MSWDGYDSNDSDFPPIAPSFEHYEMKREKPADETFRELGDEFEGVLRKLYNSVKKISKILDGQRELLLLQH